jgi:general transcription factor 3C polypeptide 6
LLLGTELLFTDDKGAFAPSAIFLVYESYIMFTKETQDRNKRPVVHVANTEQRIAFREVTLIPKLPKDKGGNTINLEGTPTDSSSKIDRMTGLSQPTRVPRTKKAASSTSATKLKAKAKGKEKVGTSKASNTNGKGKGKEVPTEDAPMDEDALEPDNIDDIYMEE